MQTQGGLAVGPGCSSSLSAKGYLVSAGGTEAQKSKHLAPAAIHPSNQHCLLCATREGRIEATVWTVSSQNQHMDKAHPPAITLPSCGFHPRLDFAPIPQNWASWNGSLIRQHWRGRQGRSFLGEKCSELPLWVVWGRLSSSWGQGRDQECAPAAGTSRITCQSTPNTASAWECSQGEQSGPRSRCCHLIQIR